MSLYVRNGVEHSSAASSADADKRQLGSIVARRRLADFYFRSKGFHADEPIPFVLTDGVAPGRAVVTHRSRMVVVGRAVAALAHVIGWVCLAAFVIDGLAVLVGSWAAPLVLVPVLVAWVWRGFVRRAP